MPYGTRIRHFTGISNKATVIKALLLFATKKNKNLCIYSIRQHNEYFIFQKSDSCGLKIFAARNME